MKKCAQLCCISFIYMCVSLCVHIVYRPYIYMHVYMYICIYVAKNVCPKIYIHSSAVCCTNKYLEANGHHLVIVEAKDNLY